MKLCESCAGGDESFQTSPAANHRTLVVAIQVYANTTSALYAGYSSTLGADNYRKVSRWQLHPHGALTFLRVLLNKRLDESPGNRERLLATRNLLTAAYSNLFLTQTRAPVWPLTRTISVLASISTRAPDSCRILLIFEPCFPINDPKSLSSILVSHSSLRIFWIR